MSEEIQTREKMSDPKPSEIITEIHDNKHSVNTVSSKLSTDQLICKSPQESPTNSVKSIEKIIIKGDDSSLLSLGLLQFIFGFLMLVFGGLVLHYDASLSQLGGGIWAGCLSMSTGIIGILASAREWCPLKSTPQKITHTIFLALSLVSLALAQLIVALAATGAARDINNSEYDEEVEVASTTTVPPGKISIILPVNYMSILCNLGLLAVAAAEFVVAAIASYKSSRAICPCFRRKEDYIDELKTQRDALVSSWLGKHSPPPHLYVVTSNGTASTLGKGSKMSGGLPVPVFTVPHHHQMVPPRVMHYPLIPAPLGTIPSPVIPPSPPSHKELMKKKKKHYYSKCPPRDPNCRKSKTKSRSKSRERTVTEADVVRTYTGLDKTIAEEFIDICDSRNVSLCSDTSCTSSCQRSCNGCNTNSDVASREYLVNNKT